MGVGWVSPSPLVLRKFFELIGLSPDLGGTLMEKSYFQRTFAQSIQITILSVPGMPRRELIFGVAPCVYYRGCVKGGIRNLGRFRGCDEGDTRFSWWSNPCLRSVDMGHPVRWWYTHLSDDETVAKMGHPVRWWSNACLSGFNARSLKHLQEHREPVRR